MKLAHTFIIAILSISCTHTAHKSQQDLGAFHEVRSGETLSHIARDYRVDWQELARLNGLGQPHHIQVGQQLIIPVKKQSLLDDWIKNPIQCHKQQKETKTHVQENPIHHHDLFSWPVQGRLTSLYGLRGERNHEGIDLAAPTGANIRAAGPGQVIFAGWMKGYGRTVILQHNGYRTLYAHCSRIEVRKDQWVPRGRIIAKVGSTGRSTGPHLHFEIQRGMIAVNPLKHLGDTLVGL